MSMVTSDPITLLNDVKPFKTTWKVEVKVLHSWTQHSSYSGGDSLQFILADKRVSFLFGVKIHCTCKKLFYGRVKKLQVGQWRFIENFLLTASAGKYRATSHKYKMSIISNSIVSNSSLKNDDKFLSLTSFKEIMNGSLDSNFLIDVIGQAIDIGDIQVVPVQGGKETKKLELTLTDTEDQQVACCLWGRFAEQMLYTSKVAQVNQNFLCLLRFAKINVYKGQVQITNSFDSSLIEINPPGFDVQDYLQVLPNNDLALTTGSHEVAKTQGNKRQPDKWSTYPERSILDIIMATETEKCIVKGTIFAIDTDWAWYYFGCVKCHFKKVTDITKRDVVPVKHLWRCDGCHQSITNVAPKFKLHLLIKDDTGETRVLLLDSIAEPILGVSAEVLLDGSLEEIEDPEDLPDVINDLIGKTFKFGVYVSKDNVDYGSDIFNIGKTWSADEIISQSDDENTEDTLTNIALSDRSSGQVSLISIESEDTTCLSSTPLSKRKGNNEIDDFSSTSKKQCSKIIKVEKNGGE
ncbi:unnamed protein product [Brassica rapa subsp. narinosa]|uniref:Replication factor A C-terminal domain-containing protein n=1 Tax=Brassica campestris TaxID=3711 RepID=A0A3P5Z6J4_BRACM|nr:unnamed protein product [Brassica rapa]